MTGYRKYRKESRMLDFGVCSRRKAWWSLAVLLEYKVSLALCKVAQGTFLHLNSRNLGPRWVLMWLNLANDLISFANVQMLVYAVALYRFKMRVLTLEVGREKERVWIIFYTYCHKSTTTLYDISSLGFCYDHVPRTSHRAIAHLLLDVLKPSQRPINRSPRPCPKHSPSPSKPMPASWYGSNSFHYVTPYSSHRR